ncbi:MAG: S8 family serine peptidase, partial [Bdellovibrionales bacterium]|nr:S8 family serine peptidase [Bdellovibrionales bacterium]
MITKGLFIFLSFALSGLSANAAEYLVKYKEGAEYQMQAALTGTEVADFSETASLVKMNIDEKAEGARLVEVMSDPSVEYVVPNFQVESFTLPMTPMANLRDQWSMTKVRAIDAWKRAGNRGNKKVVVAVIDSGVDSEHESLKPNLIPGFNLRDNNTDTADIVGETNPGHGTHCAGVVGATGLIAGGVVGIAPDIAIMPLRFLGSDGRGDAMSAIKAIDYAVKNGAKIISASWGAKIKM